MPTSELAKVLIDERERIVRRFVVEVENKELSPPGTPPALVVDHIPVLLDDIAGELFAEQERQRAADEPRGSLNPVQARSTARKHGEQRWRLGYDLQALVREYGVLRQCILDAAVEAHAAVSIDDFAVLSKCLSVAIEEATAEHLRHRAEELAAQKAQMEFLAEAGQILASSLDYRSTLSRLTDLVVPRLADFCEVHLEGTSLEDMPVAHVDASKVEALRELHRKYPLPADSPFGYPAVVRTGRPELMESLDPNLLGRIARGEEHLALMRSLNVCSWLVVPLKVAGNVFGAVVMAHSVSGRHYSEKDVTLASEIAGRAAVAIDNARLYDRSQQERSRMEAATRAKDEFVAMVSHELRSPLNAILGWLRLMRSGTLPEERRVHALDVIERNADAQSQLIADLLDISRIITGKLRINPAQIEFGAVVEMAIEGLRPAAGAKRITIEVDLDRDSTVMRGDGDRLQQVVWNVVGNAVKFTQKGGTVRVRLRRVESDLELTVDDDGPGIAPTFLPFVFESFRQSEGGSTRSHGGLGIGLSIVKHIVELHGGSIEAYSPGLGRGTTISLRLPISPLVSTTMGVSRVPATKDSSPDAVPPVGLEGLRVLVVDDEVDARDLVAFVLERSGMEVRVAGSAAEALSHLASFSAHVIVSDIGMPAEDGYSLIRSVRTLADETKKNTPAIALTAFAGNEDRTRALVAGFNVHMAKPVEPTALVRAIVELASPRR